VPAASTVASAPNRATVLPGGSPATGAAAARSRGLIERDIENARLAADSEAGPLDDLIGHSITYRIAVGPRTGQQLFTLQTLPGTPPELEGDPNGAACAGGLSLHAGVAIAPGERARLGRLCRYVSRPPVAAERLALTASGQARYTLRTPHRDGTTHLVLEPLDLMARLAALVPPPRMHLTRSHGVFAPQSKLRTAPQMPQVERPLGARGMYARGRALGEHVSSCPSCFARPRRQKRGSSALG